MTTPNHTLRELSEAPSSVVHRVTVETGDTWDPTTVSLAVLQVSKPDGTTVTWSATMSEKTATGLTLTHPLAVGGTDVPLGSKGQLWSVKPKLTLPGGVLYARPVAISIIGSFDF